MVFEDNGIGFDTRRESTPDKISGLHQTFHHNERRKGIGLYLVHYHVTSLGGKISVESEVNKEPSLLLLSIRIWGEVDTSILTDQLLSYVLT